MTWMLLAAAFLQSPAGPLADQALAAAQHGNGSAAASLWQEALSRDSKHYPSLFNYGVFLHRSGQAKEAADLLDRAAALEPGYQVHLMRGMNYQQLGLREDAIRAWKSALGFQPKNVKLMQVLSVEYSRGRYFREAASIAREALKLAPGEENLYLVAIKAHQDAGDLGASGELAQEA